MLPFDTHKAVKALTDAGADEALAEAVVATVREAVGGNLATKDDLQRETSSIRADMKALELRMTIKLGGIVIASSGLVIALVKLLP